jgi:hypothetical protein
VNVARNPNRGAWKARQRLALLQAERRVRDAEARLAEHPVSPDWGADKLGPVCAKLFSSLCVEAWDRHRALELLAEGYVLARDERAKER